VCMKKGMGWGGGLNTHLHTPLKDTRSFGRRFDAINLRISLEKQARANTESALDVTLINCVGPT
jgi:hypothetical protein